MLVYVGEYEKLKLRRVFFLLLITKIASINHVFTDTCYNWVQYTSIIFTQFQFNEIVFLYYSFKVNYIIA